MKKLATTLIALLIFSLLLPLSVAGVENPYSPSYGSLFIHKYEQEPGAAQGDADGRDLTEPVDGIPLEGVTYQIIQTHEYNKEFDTWTEVTDGFTSTKVTGPDGITGWMEIPLGRYKVQEIDGPDHVNLNTQEFFVDIPMTVQDGSESFYHVNIYPKNETIRNDVELTKKDGSNNLLGLPGVIFELYGDDDELFEGTETFTTDQDGKILIKNLPYGNYYFKETQTLDGYVLGDQRIEFSVEDSDSEIKVEAVNYREPDIKKDVNVDASNRGEEVTYSITIDVPGDMFEYTNFTVTDVLDDDLSYVDGSWSVTGVDSTAFTFGQNGQTLTWDVYDFSAFQSVNQVVIEFDVLISEEATANDPISNEASVNYTNKHDQSGDKTTDPVEILPTAGTLLVIKQDGDNQALLQGAEFKVVNTDTEEVFTGTTDENGEIDFGELDYGDYELIETKAPMYDDDGVMKPYNKLNNPISFTVNADNSDHIIAVDNFKSGWELPKTGGIGTSLFTLIGALLMGTAFVLYIRHRRNETA
ncbi:SpaA isopeptide-forming pilin-related protein [Allobacillus sp. GCM10007491]|uniref:Isopeptide-forming domain-containing fimbrial protein n=1 Tax=Allobacillus saliphilus TaxID=2912308 RepID=A0A941HST2_9BACI|nr:SpaA isopeptide-forming pilin-related protein [Allobacillus saliphilus]MBR7552564.1 isopeptide-forming domain-containing fimbrial protein [Allobacillus saliphilus]